MLFPLADPHSHKHRGILIGAVIAWMMVCVFLGPEANGAHFENAKVGFQAGGGATAHTDLVRNMDEDKAVTDHQEDVRRHGEK
jgi:SHS family lactate transporter-like MFS transporter